MISIKTDTLFENKVFMGLELRQILSIAAASTGSIRIALSWLSLTEKILLAVPLVLMCLAYCAIHIHEQPLDRWFTLIIKFCARNHFLVILTPLYSLQEILEHTPNVTGISFDKVFSTKEISTILQLIANELKRREVSTMIYAQLAERATCLTPIATINYNSYHLTTVPTYGDFYLFSRTIIGYPSGLADRFSKYITKTIYLPDTLKAYVTACTERKFPLLAVLQTTKVHSSLDERVKHVCDLILMC
jgi:hypothetical protein